MKEGLSSYLRRQRSSIIKPNDCRILSAWRGEARCFRDHKALSRSAHPFWFVYSIPPPPVKLDIEFSFFPNNSLPADEQKRAGIPTCKTGLTPCCACLLDSGCFRKLTENDVQIRGKWRTNSMEVEL
tara:strand:+ start:985 stop:1365 length:381 start_codon:yes stop_codon:yes gene_type:complete